LNTFGSTVLKRQSLFHTWGFHKDTSRKAPPYFRGKA
jgi:hypothetical protein